MKSNKVIDALTIGFALFAMFFGAGNIILPPILGLITGADWEFAVTGFSLTAILAPFLGILAVLFSGDDFTDLGKRLSPLLGWVLATAIVLSIGPLVAIPRTAATTYEVGVLAVFPDFSPVLSSILFFGVTLALSISPSKVVDIIGRYLTPLLLILLLGMIILGVVNPMDTKVLETVTNPDAFRLGFAEGYQTMDVLASVIYAGIIISAVKSRGYSSLKEKTDVTLWSGIVATSCLLFIYGGLVYLGTTSGYTMSESLKRTDLLIHIANGILGSKGALALALCIALACLTTAIALVCATGTFFNQLTNGRVSYKLIVVLTCVFSGVLAVEGVDSIIEYAAPFLEFIYPITLTLIIYMVVFGKIVAKKAPFVFAILASALLASFKLSGVIIGKFGGADYLLWVNKTIASFPLSKYEVPWLIPSFITFLVVFLIQYFFAKKE